MDKSILVSVRVPESMVKELDRIALEKRFYKRSTLIHKAIRFMLLCEKHGLLSKILTYNSYYVKVDKLEFEYHHEHK